MAADKSPNPRGREPSVEHPGPKVVSLASRRLRALRPSLREQTPPPPLAPAPDPGPGPPAA